MSFGFVLPKLFMLFAAITAAFIATKRGILKKEANMAMSNVVTHILNPAMMISSAMTGERILTNVQVLTYLLIAFAVYLALVALSFAIPFILHLPKNLEGLYRFMFIFSNIGFFGMPAVQAIYGTEALILVAVFMFPFQLLTFTYGITLVAGKDTKIKFSWKMLLHPMIVSSVLTFILYFLRIPLPDFVQSAVTFLSNGSSPLAMIVVGCTLASVPLRNVFCNWRQYVLVLLKMIVCPLCLYLLLRWIMPDTAQSKEIITICAVITAMPTAANSVILSTQYHGDPETASCGVFLATAFSAVSIPFLIWIFGIL